jgi:hyperosmotically inducible periplasmic protein
MNPRNYWLASSLLLVLASGCNRTDGESERKADAPQGAVAADNTKKNERDTGNTLTPGDQAENEADRTITQQIRQAVVDKDSLSMNAKNVKIITANGVVTLRGPVKTPDEKADIAAIAQRTSGVTRVDNQIEVAN